MLAALLLFTAFFSIVLVGTLLVVVHDFIAARLARPVEAVSLDRRPALAAPQPRRELTRVRTLGHA